MTDPTSERYQWHRNGTAIAGASSASYKVQSADLGARLTCAVTATNPAGSATALSAPTGAVTQLAGLPSRPSGPVAPAAGYRLVFADDFNGPSVDTTKWTLGPGGESTGPQHDVSPYNDVSSNWEAALLDSNNLSVSDSNLVMKLSPISPTVDSRGITHSYMGCAIMSAPSDTTGFRFSPAFAGTLYFQWRGKTTGSASRPGQNGCAYPAFWASTVRTWGRTTDDLLWTREMDFQEWAGGYQPIEVDSNNLVQPGGYGTSGDLVGNESTWGSGQPNIPTTNGNGPFDPSQDFHVYTMAVYTTGAFDVWIDGTYFRNTPVENVGTFGAPTVDVDGNPHSYASFSTAYDWMAIIIQNDMCRPPGDGWTGDEMLIDYVMVWQDAAIPSGQGVQGGGISPGTVVETAAASAA